MAHPAQQEFCGQVKHWQPQFFTGQKVLEIGSRNINGTLRTLFSDCEYLGLDCTAGPGVDVVCLAHEFGGQPNSFDVVLSTEVLEHDPHAELTVRKMRELLKPGGLCLITCASLGRAEHGTSRQGERYGPNPSFYRNVSLGQLAEWLKIAEGTFQEAFLKHHRKVGDLYFYGIKA